MNIKFLDIEIVQTGKNLNKDQRSSRNQKDETIELNEPRGVIRFVYPSPEAADV